MFKEIKVVATFNERTGYGIHGSRFFPKLLDRLGKFKDGEGVATVSLLDVVSASHVTAVHPSPSILYNVWESTEYPMAFMEKLKNYDQLWVPSEWQRSCSIAQGIPEEFVKVVPEGVDPDVYKPVDVEIGEIFTFVHVGQWQPRKSTLEVIQSFLKAFPDNDSVRLELSVDTLFPSDQYKSTEERLEACGIKDKRIIVVHFEEREDYIRRLQRARCFVSCSRSEGWGLPIIEAMACFPSTTMVVANDIRRTMVKAYSGELVVIKLDDTIIEATPEHPFWTNKGWKLAKELDNTCQLLYCPNYGGQKNEAIYAGRIGDIESAISINYDNGIIEDNGKKLFFGAMEEASDGTNKKIREHSEVSSFGYKSNGFELSGRDYRWRGNCYVKENAGEMETFDPDSKHFRNSSVVVGEDNIREVNIPVAPDKQENESGTILSIHNNGNIAPTSLPEFGAVADNKEATYSDHNRVLRDTVETGLSHQEYGIVNESYIEDKGSEYKAIREISFKSVENLPVYNFETQSGLYTAEGFLVHNCGVPTIVADFGGSTEYAFDAVKVRVPKLIKPFGIYGNWDVPGFWGEPDFDHLVEQMRAVYNDYSGYKKRALASSERIRRDFSWDKAADKAMVILENLSKRYKPQEYKIENKKEGVFVVDCWPSSKEKMQTLVETVEQIHSYGFPVIITSHYALPDEVIKKAEYYIYDREDIMSGDDKPYYWRIRPDGTRETKRANVEYQGVAAINNFRNAIDFCRGRFEWVYQMGADIEVDMETWLSLVSSSKKDLICIPYEGIKNGVGGGIMAGKTELYDKLIPRLKSWKQYADMYPNEKFVAERWLYRYFKDTMPDFDNIVDWVQIETTNRWDNVDRTVWADDDFICHFVEGPFLQIVGTSDKEYDVEWSTPTNPLVYTLKQKSGMWSRPNIKYYQPWTVKAKLNGEVKFNHTFDARGKRVLVCMGSKALGDTLAWIPYIEEFRKKWDCHMICSSWWIDILDYPEIEFVKPGSPVQNIYASFNVGCFDNQLELNVENWRTTILQKVSADILGIDYEPIKTKLKFTPHREGNGKPKKPYVCFSEYSTMQNKFWNREGAWQKIIDYLVDLGYDCISISPEGTQLKNVIHHNGQPIEHTIADIAGCEFYLGLNHGPAWIAYSLGVPAVMITGVSEPWNDFPNPYRVSSDVCRPGCFNDPSLPINRGWEWCPRNKNYECTRAITEDMVIETINRLRKDYGYACKIGKTAEIDGDSRTPSGDDLGEKQWGAINVKRTVA